MAKSSNSDLNKSNAPDPARSYERAKPEAESGMGRLDNNKATPTKRADQLEKTVGHRQGNRQINAEEYPSGSQAVKPPKKKK
jgi:hypothetical protein